MAEPLRAQRRLAPHGRRSLTLAQARRRQVRRWGVSRVSGERLMWGVRCQRAMRYLHLRPCGVRVPKRYDRPGRGCGGGAPGCGPLSPCSPTSHGVWGKWFTVKARCLSTPIAMRCGVPLGGGRCGGEGYGRRLEVVARRWPDCIMLRRGRKSKVRVDPWGQPSIVGEVEISIRRSLVP